MQDIIALAIALLAVVYLSYRVWRFSNQKKSGGCVGCSGCGGEKKQFSRQPESEFISLENLQGFRQRVPR